MRSSNWMGRSTVFRTLKRLRGGSLGPWALGGAAAQAEVVPSGFSESVIYNGLTELTDVRVSPDGRVFVSEKSGLIKVYPSLESSTPTNAADLRTEVHNFWDRGLLSIALDPQFPTRPYVYALYTLDAPIGGTAPRWGVANGTVDAVPDPAGATDDGCVVSGRLSQLTVSARQR